MDKIDKEELEFREEAWHYHQTKCGFYLFCENWEHPSDESMSFLKDKVDEFISDPKNNFVEKEELEILKAFQEQGYPADFSWEFDGETCDIQSVVDICKKNPMGSWLGEPDTHIKMSIPMTMGGPTHTVDFYFFPDGTLDYAESYHASGGKTNVNRLPDDMAQELAEFVRPYFSFDENESRSPRY